MALKHAYYFVRATSYACVCVCICCYCSFKMATEESPLLINNADPGSINAPRNEEAKSISQVLVDIRAGRVHIGPVLIYTLIAVVTNFELNSDEYSYFGVSYI